MRYQKRGGAAVRITLDEMNMAGVEPERDLVALDDALGELAKVDARKSKVVELRFFGGLSIDEAAEFLDVAPVTVKRHWTFARAWLHRELKSGYGDRASGADA